MTRRTAGSISPRIRLPGGLLGMVVMVIGCELLIAKHRLDLSPPVAWLWRQSARAVAREAPASAILCFGDSQMKTGMAPLVLEQRLRLRAFNFAVTGAQAPATFFLLRRALQAGARPRAVLVNFKPLLLTMSRGLSLHEWSELLSVRDTVELSWTARDSNFCAAVLVRMALPSLRHRDSLRARAYAAVTNREPSSNEGLLACWRNAIVNRGGNLAAPKPAFWSSRENVEEAVRRDRSLLYPDRWECDPVNLIYMRKFFALAARHDLRVYLLLPPVVPGVQSHRDRQGLDTAYLKLVDEIRSTNSKVTVLDARHSGYDASVFTDPAHLDGRGAARLSADVAEALRGPIANAAAAPDWIELPPFRSEAVGIALEDSLDSWKAVRRRGAMP